MATLLYFGRLSETLGTSSQMLLLPPDVADTAALRTWLDTTYELDGAMQEASIRIAINDEIVAEPAPLSDGDTIAFLPPVGGG